MVTPAGGSPYQPIHHDKQSNPEIEKEIEQLEQLLENDKNVLSPKEFNQIQNEIEELKQGVDDGKISPAEAHDKIALLIGQITSEIRPTPQDFEKLQAEIEALLHKLPLEEQGEFSVQMNALIQAYHDGAISGGATV